MKTACVVMSLLVAGCTAGMGPSTAATRPLLGHVIRNDDAKMWVKSSDQSNVPAGLVRVEQVSDGFARVFNYVSITSAVRKGSKTPTIADAEQDGEDVLELDLAFTGRIPLPIGGVSLGVGRVMWLDDDISMDGFGVRASVAPIGQLSVDFEHSWISGSYTSNMASFEASGTSTSLGGTLLLFGYNTFRFGVHVAKTWMSAGAYESSGYTWSLVSTMY